MCNIHVQMGMSPIAIMGFVYTKDLWQSVLAMKFDPSSRNATIVHAQWIVETMWSNKEFNIGYMFYFSIMNFNLD
jgi:hypothetical protein